MLDLFETTLIDELPIRARRCVQRAGVRTLAELVKYDDFWKVRNCGPKTFLQIEYFVELLGARMKGECPASFLNMRAPVRKYHCKFNMDFIARYALIQTAPMLDWNIDI